MWHRLQVLISKLQYKYLVSKANQRSEEQGKTVSIGEVLRDIIDEDMKKE